MKKIIISILCYSLAVMSVTSVLANQTNVKEPKAQAIDWVWSGQRVWFDFISQGNYQLVAYYDAARQMSVAVREMGDINGAPWIYHKVPSFLGWDAHNKVVAAFDKHGYIHIAGNMHANPLVYFRSTQPYNPRSLVQENIMVSADKEQQMTYPDFFVDQQQELYFKYRLGTSSQGRWYYNHWNTETQQWQALHPTTLLDGEDERSVYPLGPIIGPDGYFHLVFVWRENPRASSNHDLSYAKSKDLIHWQTSTGKPLTLPIKLGNSEIIDPIPMHGGLLNGRTPIGFDRDNNIVVVYQKYDQHGNSQVFLLRNNNNTWQSVQVSNWQNSRIDFDKSGALDIPLITTTPSSVDKAGNIIVQATWHGVDWQWLVDHKTLKVISGQPIDKKLPAAITQYDLNNQIPLRVVPMRAEQKQQSSQYYLSWEAMQPNRDQARSDIPSPSTLRVHKITQK